MTVAERIKCYADQGMGIDEATDKVCTEGVLCSGDEEAPDAWGPPSNSRIEAAMFTGTDGKRYIDCDKLFGRKV